MLRTPVSAAAGVPTDIRFAATDALAAGLLDGSLLVGGMPPQPPTLRGKTGRILVGVVRRSVFWLSEQIRAFQAAVAASQRELAHHVRSQSAEMERLRQMVQSGEQARLVSEELSARFDNWTRQLAGDWQAQAAAWNAKQEDLRAKQEDITGHLMRRIHDVLLRVEGLEKEHVAEHVTRVDDNLRHANRTIDELKRITQEQNARIVQLTETLRQADRYFHQTRMQLALQERRLTTLIRETRAGTPAVPSPAVDLPPVTDPIYVEFEDLYRGDREDIKQRFAYYIPRLQEAGLGTADSPVLDVGCGRGEWLELLRENGLTASGVDSNTVMVEECLGRGLSCVLADVISYLRSLPDSSRGVITGFHIVEHLPLDVLLTLLDETNRVLRRGGMAIFETPNPANMLVSTENFYMDPTHRNPLPKALLKFLMEARGLCDVDVLPLHPYPQSYQLPDDGRPATHLLNQLLFSEQDYAVIGRKA